MFRTRDLFLYVLTLLLLVVGIGLTIALQQNGSDDLVGAKLLSSASSDDEPEEAVNSPELDRALNLEKLRAKIARGDGLIAEGSPVMTSVDSPATTSLVESENPDAIVEQTDRTAQYCFATVDLLGVSTSWPSSGVSITKVEGARLITVTEEVFDTIGSSTVATTTTQVRLQLPSVVTRGLASQCLDSTVIGVALTGELLKNDEVWRYRNFSPESIIGYARDGLPVYGQGVDETLLDSCGGYDPGVGYRYHVRANEPFVIGCYAGTPQSFIY